MKATYLAIIRRMDNYSSMCNSMLKTFPAQQIIDEILKHLVTVDSKNKDLLDLTLDPVIQLCNRYKAGTRGYVKRSVVDLINRYLRVEAMFQSGHYDKIVSKMWSEHKDNIWFVVETLFANTQYRHRNIVMTTLLASLWDRKEGKQVVKDMKDKLRELTNTLVRYVCGVNFHMDYFRLDVGRFKRFGH